MNLGTKIKELRASRHMTQEELATALGISFQAVSKWECGISLPDITLAPAIASYFGVSLDELFDFRLEKVEKDVRAIVDAAYIYRESDPEKGRAIIEEGLSKYPDNDILLNNLLYVLNYSADPDTTVSIASRLISVTKKDEIKYDALRFLAYAYHAKGEDSAALAAIEQIPEIYFNALTEKAYLFKGKEGFDAAEKQKWVSFENLLQMIWKTVEYYESAGETAKALTEAKRGAALIPVMDNVNYDTYAEFFAKNIELMEAL